MSCWEDFFIAIMRALLQSQNVGELVNVVQLTGLDVVKLITFIFKAVGTTWMHKNNCRQFAQHLKLIGNFLDKMKIMEL